MDHMEDLNYEVIDTAYIDKQPHMNISIKYPQVAELNDAIKQNSINAMIKDEALKVLNYYLDPGSMNDPDLLSADITYTIKWKSPDLLSIQYSGTGFNKGAAHPNNLFYTTNINMIKGNKLRLRDIVAVDDHFIEKIHSGNFQISKDALLKKTEIITELGNRTTAELIEDFQNADSLDSIGTDKQSDIFSFFTDHSLGISIPVSHALGDHTEFEINYTDYRM